MRFGSVCSGIEAASVAWHPLGWRAAWLAEIEPFPSAVLAHHYPEVPNLGDMSLLPARIAAGEVEAPDVFCGGTPCQAFSVAGLRRSLDDARGNLSLIFCEIADAIDHARAARGEQPAIVFWENVPGVLSTKDNAFGCFLAGLAGEDDALVAPGGKWSDAGVVLGPQRAVAWRVLDAQYFGLAQRRRRVFVVASAREDFDPVEVLLVEQGVRRASPPCREAREGVAASVIKGAAIGRKPEAGPQYVEHLDDGSCYTLNCVDQHAVVTGGLGVDTTHTLTFSGNRTGGPIDVSPALLAQPGSGWKGDFESEAFITTTHTLRGEGFDASEDGTGRGTPLVPVAFHPTQDPISSTDGTTHAMGCGSKGGTATVAVAFAQNQLGEVRTGDVFNTNSNASGRSTPMLVQATQVRRLTPRECDRLQGFSDDYTLIPWRGKPADQCPDGPRYKALGNSWAVPVVRWIGARINDQMLLA